jgi:hypothetical protein
MADPDSDAEPDEQADTDTDAVRSGEQRHADALAQLEAQRADCWVATASAAGRPYLVPLSFAWWDGLVVLVTPAASPTVRNVEAGRTARVAFGHTRDVLLVDTTLVEVLPVDDPAAARPAGAFAAQSDWDPRGEAGYVVLTLRPQRAQAWREAPELAGRTIMRDGRWLFGSGVT